MNYREAVAYIEGIQAGAQIKPGLRTVRNLLERLGNPQESLRFIHVAGTNGKGSTAALISAVLAESGYCIGRYVSPAVFSEREIIQRQEGQKIHWIEEEEFARLTETVRPVIDEFRKEGRAVPTKFEIETALAFLAFAAWNCDIVVLEAGMGGRLDATNIVKHVDCAVITSISMDHMQFLGHTPEEIAWEKAGIIKPDIPVVIGKNNAAIIEKIKETCREKRARPCMVDPDQLRLFTCDQGGSRFSYRDSEVLEISLPGVFQADNACLALECLWQCRSNYTGITAETIAKGFLKAEWPGRFQIFGQMPSPVVVDGAHNPEAVMQFCRSLKEIFPDRECLGIMGVFADKDYPAMACRLKGTFRQILTVTPPSPRGLAASCLAVELRKQGIDAQEEGSLREALQRGARQQGERVLCVFGSLSLMRGACDILPEVYAK